MVQGLAEQGQVHRSWLNGGGFNVSQAVFQIVQAVLAGQFLPQFHHAGGIVHRNDPFGAGRNKLGDEPLSRPQVGDNVVIQDAEQRPGQRLP